MALTQEKQFVDFLARYPVRIFTVDGESQPKSTIQGLILLDDDGNPTGTSGNPIPVSVSSGSITVDSEFPDAAAITDNFANPTTTSVMAMGMVYDGSAWDRMLGDSTDGVLVNLGSNNDVTLATLPDTAAGDLAAINTLLGTIDTDTSSLAGCVSGTEVQVDVLTLPDVTQSTHDNLNANANLQVGDTDVDATNPVPVSVFEGIESAGLNDVFHRQVVVSPNNDVDIQFFRAAPELLVNVTTANSATATQNNGGALFASSTNANGSVQGVTNQKTVYRSGSEIYCMFTASFTAGIASSYMRIGLFDANDGFFLGYEGTTFGVTYRNNTTDTTINKGSWSEDQLTGAAGSSFQRAGTPEAIDLTKLNVFRIRFGWLGSAPVYFEVMSPDGNWVTFHKVLFPNLQATPSIESADLPMTIDITKTAAAATDLQIQTDCWGAGATLTEQSGFIDPINSRFASTLSAATTWTGGFTDVHRFALTKILIYSSTNNASGTLYADFSMDGTTVHRTIEYDVTDAATHPPHVLIPVAQFLRFRYTADAGGGNDHSDFTVQTIHHVTANKLPTSKIDSDIRSSTDVNNVRAVIAGETTAGGGSFVNVKVAGSGALQVEAVSEQADIATVADDKTGSIVAVATSSTAIASSNANRHHVYIENQTNQDIGICLKTTAVYADRVYTLFNKGDFVNIPGWYHQGAVSAIHAGTGTKNVLVVEVDE